MGCSHKKIKIIRTHGKKSRGYLVCKDCNKLIKKSGKKNGTRRKKSK